MEFQFDVFYFEQFFELFGDGVFWFGQDFDQGWFVQFFQGCDYWQVVDEFGNQVEFDQVFWFDFGQYFVYFLFVFVVFYFGVEVNVVDVGGMCLDYFVQFSECVVVDEQDVFGVYLQEFLLWVFVVVLWWNVCYGIFDQFQQGLLYVFVGYIVGD